MSRWSESGLASAWTAARTTATGGGLAIRSGLSSFGLRLAGLASTFALGVVLARALGPADFGIYGLVTTVAALAASVALLGTPQLAVRELSVRSAQGDWAGVKAVIRRFGMATSIAAIAMGMIAVLMGVAIDPGGEHVIYVIEAALLTPLMVLTALIAAELRGLGSMFRGQLLDIFGRPALTFAIILAIVLSGARLNAVDALWVQVAVALLAAIVSLAWIRRAVPVEARSTPPTRGLTWIAAAVPLGAVDILRQFDGTYGVVLMGWLASEVELGLFRVAVACSVVAMMPLTILHVILAPTVARLNKQEDRAPLQRLLGWTSAASVAMVAPIVLAAYLIGRPAIELVFGVVYGEAWLPLFVLCLAQLLFGLFGMGPILLAMCDGERALIKIYLVSVGVATFAAVPLIDRFGATGAAATQIISFTMVGLASWHYGRRTLGVDISFVSLFRTAVRPLPG